MSYFSVPQREEGGERRVLTTDERIMDLLEGIFTTLKKIEYHQSIATDTELTDDDV